MRLSIQLADVHRVVELIEHRSADPLTVRSVAQALGCSEDGLGELFRQHMGVTIRAYLAECRIMRAANSIRFGEKIEAAALKVGYRSMTHFYEQFRRYLGTTPGHVRKGGTFAGTHWTPHRGKTKASVLLIGPFADDRDMYAEFLCMKGFEVIIADTGDDGLMRAPMADVIVTEIRIGGVFDGNELIRRLRKDRRTARKPIVALTSCAFAADREAARHAGCDVFLAKPCLPDTLLAELLLLLRSHRHRACALGVRRRAATAQLRCTQTIDAVSQVGTRMRGHN
jgi:two-component system cell cycle response regulator DivK